jgi:hypothetical protein
VGINFHITSVREGTIFNVMQFLSLERVTGILNVSFGRSLPEGIIYFVTGNVTTAEFGAIVGDAVLDMLLCQEYAIKEVSFAPGRINQLNEQAIIVRASLSGVMLNVSKDVDKCQSRPYIYGTFPLAFKDGRIADSLLHVLHDFGKWNEYLSAIPKSDRDRAAPLKECVLLYRGALKPLLDIVQPLSDKESNNLRGYMRSLLPQPKATHMSIDRFYAFASAIESIAQRRSNETGDKARRAIHQLIQQTTKSGDPSGASKS